MKSYLPLLSLFLTLPLYQGHAEEVKDLVNLSHVATERKGEEYANIENLLPIEQTTRIFIGMKQAANIVKENKKQILNAINAAFQKFQHIDINKRRIFIAGAGTSGRLAAINAIESENSSQIGTIKFNIAGGINAFVKAVEGAEDNKELAYKDIEDQNVTQHDVVISLSASGRTPYAIAYLEAAMKKGALTISIDNSPDSPLSKAAAFNISNNTGPECPRGSTRMKSGTSQYETLRLLTKLLEIALEKNTINIDQYFDSYTHIVDTALQNIEQSLYKINEYSLFLAHNLIGNAHQHARIIYIGPGAVGLLGAVDGSELGPTYTWSRIAYIAPYLQKILDKNENNIEIRPSDVLMTLGHYNDISTKNYVEKAIASNTPILDIGKLTASFKLSDDPKLQTFGAHLATNILLKIITTQFAILSGWVLEGEMINLDPNNPNKKLIARRVQTLKNLNITDNEQDALQLLEETKNDLALAVVMKRKNVDCQKAANILAQCNGNVVKAIL